MKDIKEFYILGQPIETEIGKVHFLKVKEYPDYFLDLHTVALTHLQLVYKYIDMNKTGVLTGFIEQLKMVSLFDAVTSIEELNDAYARLFTKVFQGEHWADKINKDNFNYYRNLVLEMNCVKEEKINPNPEIQRAIERSKRVKAMEGEKLEFSDICSSCVGFNGLTYNDLNDFTIYQLYMTYYRIGQIKNYDTSTLFATVSTEKINIESWSKHINLFQEESHFITEEKFKKTTASALSE